MKYTIILTILLSSLLVSEELKITAKEFKTDEKSGITTLSGDVNIIKSSDEINASNIIIYTNEKREPTKFIAQGSVSFFIKTDDNDTYKGVAGKVVYLPIQKEYQFFKDVHLEQVNDKKIIIGEEVILKTTDGDAYAKGANKEPIIMIFNMPKNKDK